MTRLLVLDESTAIRSIIKTMAGKTVLVRETDQPAEALTIVNEFRPDIAFIADWSVGGDGYKLVRELRADPANASLYIVLTTIEYSLLTWTHRRKNGVDRMLLKPFEGRDIEEAFRSWPAARSIQKSAPVMATG